MKTFKLSALSSRIRQFLFLVVAIALIASALLYFTRGAGAETLSVAVGASSDDAYHTTAGWPGFSSTGGVFVGAPGGNGPTFSGYRWTGVGIPADATITDAHIEFTQAGWGSTNITTALAFHDASDPGSFSSSDSPATRWSDRTSFEQSWTWVRETPDSLIESPSLAAGIQELVDSYGGIDTIVALQHGSAVSSGQFYTVGSFDSGAPAVLHVVFETTAPTPTPVPPTPTPTPTATPTPSQLNLSGFQTQVIGYSTDLTASVVGSVQISAGAQSPPPFGISLSNGFVEVNPPGDGVYQVGPGQPPVEIQFAGHLPVGTTSFTVEAVSAEPGSETLILSQQVIEVEAPILISQPVWQYARETQGTEINDITWFRKWMQPQIDVYVVGNSASVQTFWDVTQDLSALTSLTFVEVTDSELADLNVIVGLTVEEVIPLLPEDRQADAQAHFATNAGAFTWELQDDSQILSGVAIAVGAPYTQSFTDHNILEELAQVLGPGADSPRYADSIFYEVNGISGTVTEYSEMDQEVLKFLYDARISGGDSFDAVANRLVFVEDVDPSLLSALIASGEPVYALPSSIVSNPPQSFGKGELAAYLVIDSEAQLVNSSGWWTPSESQSWLSNGSEINVRRDGVGQYSVLLPDPNPRAGGAVHLTPIGSDGANAVTCNVTSISVGDFQLGSGVEVQVACHNISGISAFWDTGFSFSYVR